MPAGSPQAIYIPPYVSWCRGDPPPPLPPPCTQPSMISSALTPGASCGIFQLDGTGKYVHVAVIYLMCPANSKDGG